MSWRDWCGAGFAAVALAGAAYQLLAAVLVRRFFAGGDGAPLPVIPAQAGTHHGARLESGDGPSIEAASMRDERSPVMGPGLRRDDESKNLDDESRTQRRPALPPVTLLKPLHGAEPRLAENLATFLTQDYPAPVQMVCGVQSADDLAIAAVETLRTRFPRADIALVVDPATHGANAKISNLVNMMRAAKHDTLVLSDADMSVGHQYLARVVATLEVPGTGAVTCLYHGRGDAGLWSVLAAQAISHGFLPAGAVGSALGLAEACMGSTIALSRATLDRIGGFAAFANDLADDYAIGQAVRGLELAVTSPRFPIAHACADASFGALVRHELRWNMTIRRLAPVGYAISGWLNPVPVALLALACAASPLTVSTLAAALVARVGVALTVDRVTRAPPGLFWLLPVRDTLSFALFLASFLVQSVDWQGRRLRVDRSGKIRTGR